LEHQHNLDGASKGEFLAAAARTMRRILVDHARARQADKRGNQWARVTLTGLDAASVDPELEVLALNEALEKLKQESERIAAVVELRYFGGLTVEETASSLGVSLRTVAGDWAFARAWLKRELG
jgi:RNA polymerase sigma-70 factor (ECF subfamily)